MKQLLILTVILAAGVAFGQSALEPKHAPTTAQCEADARMWGKELVDKVTYEKQPNSSRFTTDADQTSLTDWIKRWLEMTTCVGLQDDPSNGWPAVTKAGIERRIFSERLLMYIGSDPARGNAYSKWEASEQAKARQRLTQAKAGKR